MRCSGLCAFATISVAGAAPLKCGVATDKFHNCPQCLTSVVQTGALDFWWNWNTEPHVDLTRLSPDVTQKMYDSFVPMLWGQGVPAGGYDFLANGSHVMGFNEPDMYGPSCDGDWDPPAPGCAKGEWRAATSSGWQPLFDPSSAQHYWQQAINNMTSLPKRSVGKVVSPSMAQGAKPDAKFPCVGVDPSKAGANTHCAGWLQQFKSYTLQLPCTDFDGRKTNCWDVIDAIQIHAYARNVSDITNKIQEYYSVFEQDFTGANGRKKKTLWLTEVAMGSNNANDIVGFITALMSPNGGLTDRSKFGFVEKVSWFSEWAWDAFTIDGVAPRKDESWSSGLFEPFGELSKLGKAFFGACAAQPSA